MFNILWRNLKWRFQNPVSIGMTIVQPLLWLALYGAVAGPALGSMAGGNYTAFILPGIMVLVTFSCCCSGGMINYIMKASGSFYRILIAPVSRSAILLGQMLEAILLSLLESAVLFGVGLFCSVQVASGLPGIILMILLIFLAGFFMAGLAYSISLCLPNEVIYETVMNTIVLPVFFVSTALFPLEKSAGALRVAVMLNPFTHIINALRSLIYGKTILAAEVLPVIGLFALLGLGGFALAFWRLKRETAC
jgi:ABC-2 type transport system permease protein